MAKKKRTVKKKVSKRSPVKRKVAKRKVIRRVPVSKGPELKFKSGFTIFDRTAIYIILVAVIIAIVVSLMK